MADTSLDELLAGLPGNPARPVHDWHPNRRGEMDLRIDTQGRWWHEGRLIERPALVKLFASILRRDEDGYWLVTPVEMQKIQVDDAPLLVTGMEVQGEGRTMQLVFTTHTDDHCLLDADHPLRVENPHGEPAPYVRVRDNLEGRLHRNVFYRLVELAGQDDPDDLGRLGVWSGGSFHPLENESF